MVTVKEPREKVFNGTFDGNDTAGWFAAGADLAAADGKLRVQVPGGTHQPYDVLVGQNDIRLERDAPYAISFTASASRPVTIKAQVQLSDPPYTPTWSQDVQLGTGQQEYHYSFPWRARQPSPRARRRPARPAPYES